MKIKLILYAFLVACICNCTSVHKIFDKEQEKSDSTQVTHKSIEEKKHIDTSKAEQVFTHSSNRVEVDLSTGIILSMDSGLNTANRGPYYLSFDPVTNTISSNQPLTHASFNRDSDSQHSNFTGGVSDSLYKELEDDSTHKKSTIVTVHKTINKKGAGLGFQIAIAISAVVLVGLFVLIAYLRKKKKQII